MLKRIEETALNHFAFLPSCVGFSPIVENGISIINCGLGSSMFNIAFGGLTASKESLSEIVNSVINRFNKQPFAWWIPQSQYNNEMGQVLIEADLKIETVEHAMICKLDTFDEQSLKTDLHIKQVLNQSQLEDFINILEPYDATARTLYQKVTTSMLDREEKLFVGYHQGKPVVISILFLNQDTAGIFSVLTLDAQRGKGFGTDMMRFLMAFAKESGAQYASLSASSDSGYRIYERLGFERMGQFECFEYPGYR